MTWAKNKSTTPSLAFPFALNQNKTGSFSKKVDMHFGGPGIKKRYRIGFPWCFPSAPSLIFCMYLLLGLVEGN